MTSGYAGGRPQRTRCYLAAVALVLAFASVYIGIRVPAVSAQTTTDIGSLQALVLSLTQKLSELQAQRASGATSSLGTAKLTRPLGRGMSGSDVAALQDFLIAKGLLASGNNTGFFGALTEQAVKAFQQQNGLEAVGSVGPLTRALINGLMSASNQSAKTATAAPATGTFARTIGRGMSGSDVAALQDFLIAKGLLASGNNTGFFGALTEQAVKAFQQQNGLEAVGSVGLLTRQILNGYVTGSGSPVSSGSNAGNAPSAPSSISVGGTSQAAIISNYTPSGGGGGGSSSSGSSGGGGSSSSGGGGGSSGGGASTPPAPADTTAPAVIVTGPVSTLAAGTLSATLTVTTNEAASCVYATTNTAAFGAATPFSTTGSMSHTSALAGLQDATSYTYYIQCKDAAGNIGTASAAFAVAAPPAATADTTAPSAPASLSAVANSASKITLTWSASTDNVGVANYQIFVNGSAAAIAQTQSLTYAATGLTASTAYAFTVKAIDAAGNLSNASNQASATTLAPADTTPPSVTITAPTTNLSAGTTQTALAVTTNEAASCRYATAASTAYASMAAFSTTGNVSHTVTLSGLQDSATYSYYVKCRDTAGNTSGNASVTFSVAAAAVAVAAGDTTPPSTPTGLTAAVSSN